MAETVTLPDFPIAGGCACGAIRYELTRPPIALFACHCTDCQTMTGSAFSLGMPVFAKHLRLTKGEPKTWLRKAESGRVIPQRFCGECGTRLFTEPAGDPPTYTLRPGTLDDTSWLRPAAAMWTKSAQPWITFGDGLTYETQPSESFMPIVEAWRAILVDH